MYVAGEQDLVMDDRIATIWRRVDGSWRAAFHQGSLVQPLDLV